MLTNTVWVKMLEGGALGQAKDCDKSKLRPWVDKPVLPAEQSLKRTSTEAALDGDSALVDNIFGVSSSHQL